MLLVQWPGIRWILASNLWLSSYQPSTIHKAHKYESQPLDITHHFDNAATRNFDGQGAYYPVHLLPQNVLKSENVNFLLANWGHGYMDNVVADGQVLSVGSRHIREFHLLYAGDWIDGETSARFEFEFADGNKQSVTCSVKNWWTLHWLNSGPVQIPYHETPQGRNYNLTQIHHWSTSVTSSSPLKRIKLPELSSYNRLHIFGISLVPSIAPPSEAKLAEIERPNPSIAVKNLHLTSRLVEDGLYKGDRVVEITIANLRTTSESQNGSDFLFGDHTVSIVGGNIVTTVPGRIRRLMPGDDARVDVAFMSMKLRSDSPYVIKVVLWDVGGNIIMESEDYEIRVMDEEYEASRESLSKHEAPRWWRSSKFGIFIHWGIYSVPGWVPIGYYEEWYHWWIHNPAQPSNILWNYHREKYGEHVVYDDFIAGFSGAKFNASAWVDLFASAGARYFVLVTKHHDGFALFNTANSTHRSSVHLSPERDFLGELMSAAKERHPELKRGTYYSMPEWFNPAFAEYGFGNWPGGLARNAYNSSKLEPYTGHIEGKDYLKDIQQQHMQILAERYESDIMWCDIGGPNRTAEFAAKWYNDARRAGRQVTMNNRCGVAPDFDTPEYARFSSVQTHSWETNEGIDPYSYGYNRQTKDEDYRSARDIIHSLVDIVSKNGNYLLNLGPTGDGEIIPAMVERLVEVGKWLNHSGDCIYDTTYSFSGAEEGNLRFTTTVDTFCIIALDRPPVSQPEDAVAILEKFDTYYSGGRGTHRHVDHAILTVERPIPVLPQDKIFLLGGQGQELPWSYKDGRLRILVPQIDLDRVHHAWTFEIRYI